MAFSTGGVYSHSGIIGSAIFVVPIVGVIAALVLGTAYAFIDVYSPIAGYVSLLFIFGFAFGLGWVISQIGYVLRCRNTTFLFVAGLLAGLIGLYTSWAAFEFALLNRYSEGFEASLINIFLSPAAIWELAKSINEKGWYTIGGMTPSGVVLWAFWGIEAVAIVIGTAIFSISALSDEVFCERCEQWMSKVAGKVRLACPEDQAQLEKLAPDNLEPLWSLANASTTDNPQLCIDAWECRACKDNPAVQVKVRALVTNKKGDVEEQLEDVTPIWTVTSAAFERLSDLTVRPSGVPVEPQAE
jgi:hypothetical protein